MAHSGLLYSQNRCKSSRSRCARTLLKVVLQDLLEPDLLMLREVLRPFEQAPTVLREDRLVAVPLQHGFPYLTAVMDLDSRNVLSWRLPTRSPPTSASRHSTCRCRNRGPKSTARITALSSRRWPSRADERGAAWPSRWMVAAELSTTCSSSGFTKPLPTAHQPRSPKRADGTKRFAVTPPLRRARNEGTTTGTQPVNRPVAAGDPWNGPRGPHAQWRSTAYGAADCPKNGSTSTPDGTAAAVSTTSPIAARRVLARVPPAAHGKSGGRGRARRATAQAHGAANVSGNSSACRRSRTGRTVAWRVAWNGGRP